MNRYAMADMVSHARSPVSRRPLYTPAEVRERLGLTRGMCQALVRRHGIKPNLMNRQIPLYDLAPFQQAINQERGEAVYTIRSGVPVPPIARGEPRLQALFEALALMQVGDTMEVSQSEVTSVRVWAGRQSPPRKFASRRTEDVLRYSVWRIV